MRLEQSFDVAAPVDRVWHALIDIEKVAPCLPGAAVSGRNEDGSYAGTFTVKIGPTSASYAGKLMMEKVDEATHTAKMQANGTDKRGQGSAKASIVSTVSVADDNRTRVVVETDYHITGRLARFGRGGMIEDISERLLRQFAERLQGMLEGPGDGAPGQDDGGGATDRSETASPEEIAEPRSDEPPTGERAGEPRSRRDQPGLETPVMTEPVPSEPLEGLSLVGSVIWDRARRSPAPFAFVAGILLALILLGRRRR
jgi:uncharacterized protein